MTNTTNRIQFKAFKMENFDADLGTVEGYASTYGNIDKANDVVMAGAFKKAVLNGPERVRFLWEHDRKEVIGVITDMYEDDAGLYIKAQFASTRRAQETRDLMKMGAVDSFSIGYRVIREEKSVVMGKSANLLREIQLLEVSCVAWPCNVEARMTAIKSELDERFEGLTLDQQALVHKFLDFLENETKADEVDVEKETDELDTTGEETTEVTVEDNSEGVEADDELAALKAIEEAFVWNGLASAIR